MNTTSRKQKTDKVISKLVSDQFVIPNNVLQNTTWATTDLYYGPGSMDCSENGDGFGYKGFSNACKVIKEWCDDTLQEVWIDMDCEDLLLSEPEEFIDQDTGEVFPVEMANFIHLEVSDVKRFMFGELAKYL